MRLTESRRAVFQALLGQEPQTMRQLVAACPTIDRASVYRTVILFERLGIIQRLQIGWKYKLELTEDFSHHHHHLTCLHCGRVISFDESPALEAELRRIAVANNFAVQSHQLEIQGLCERCGPTRSLT
jgi:Fur family ferric uptake transcriptional regulator